MSSWHWWNRFAKEKFEFTTKKSLTWSYFKWPKSNNWINAIKFQFWCFMVPLKQGHTWTFTKVRKYNSVSCDLPCRTNEETITLMGRSHTTVDLYTTTWSLQFCNSAVVWSMIYDVMLHFEIINVGLLMSLSYISPWPCCLIHQLLPYHFATEIFATLSALKTLKPVVVLSCCLHGNYCHILFYPVEELYYSTSNLPHFVCPPSNSHRVIADILWPYWLSFPTPHYRFRPHQFVTSPSCAISFLLSVIASTDHLSHPVLSPFTYHNLFSLYRQSRTASVLSPALPVSMMMQLVEHWRISHSHCCICIILQYCSSKS